MSWGSGKTTAASRRAMVWLDRGAGVARAIATLLANERENT